MVKKILPLLAVFLVNSACATQVLESGVTYHRTDLIVTNVEVGTQGDPNLCDVYAVDPAISTYSTHAYFDATTAQGKNLLTIALFLKQSGGKTTLRFVANQASVLLNSNPALSTTYRLLGLQAQ